VFFDTWQTLCRVPDIWHSAQTFVCRWKIRRVLVAECYTRQSLSRVYLGLRRVLGALCKVTVSVVRPLQVWRRSIFSKWRLKSALVDIILLELEKAQERRNLTAEELEFKKWLKAKSLGLAVIQNAKARQHSRLTWIREGYSNTKAVSDSRKCKEKENVH